VYGFTDLGVSRLRDAGQKIVFKVPDGIFKKALRQEPHSAIAVYAINYFHFHLIKESQPSAVGS
jgi:hypothetical protein